jgi:hypothetical protein
MCRLTMLGVTMMADCAVGSVRGYDDAVVRARECVAMTRVLTHVQARTIDIVKETRHYAPVRLVSGVRRVRVRDCNVL